LPLHQAQRSSTRRSHKSRAKSRVEERGNFPAAAYHPRETVGKELLQGFQPIHPNVTLETTSNSGYIGSVACGEDYTGVWSVEELCGINGLGFQYVNANVR
jgi:hypothetical protein